jgi:hypothetical protein
VARLARQARKPYLVRLAPEGWKEQHDPPSQPQPGVPLQQEPQQLTVSAKETRSAWARPIAKALGGGSIALKVKAVITDPE